MYTLTLSSPEDSNGLGDPTRVAPVTSTASMSAPGVLLELPPWSFVMRTSTRLWSRACALSLSLSLWQPDLSNGLQASHDRTYFRT